MSPGDTRMRTKLILTILIGLALMWTLPKTVVRAGDTGGAMLLAGTAKVYYDPTIKDIIMADCARCHSGLTRNLTDFDSLKMYADSGMLAAMVSGTMRRFAGNDAQTIIDWVDQGAPEKPGGAAANFMTGLRGPRAGGQGQPPAVSHQAAPGGEQITYENTIKPILEADCLRCHSGPFRNMATYENVKLYVDNGLLKELVRVGGPMHRFAGPDSRLIISWVNSGAPRQ